MATPTKPVYTVDISPTVYKQLKQLAKPVKKRLIDKIESLSVDPRPHGYKQLVGFKDFYRVRVGDYRIIYSIFDDVLTIAVLKIGNRREIYK